MFLSEYVPLAHSNSRYLVSAFTKSYVFTTMFLHRCSLPFESLWDLCCFNLKRFGIDCPYFWGSKCSLICCSELQLVSHTSVSQFVQGGVVLQYVGCHWLVLVPSSILFMVFFAYLFGNSFPNFLGCTRIRRASTNTRERF